ncbi:hypothetical protein [Myxococcus virescens]|uniref:Peptidase C39-like domain-containing protein n=1 Tax=Myxococcus virescens TaxID=83456 RepID=A0A511HM33_9BACT|nr:hypothetical protein [Myxococcus virescens]GEL74642.1 hypothetical protein MVI01_64260 [Myxococcus virescens]SDE54891.1 hypothetical protein SAMN04488504_108170 [Myxococcus virescens]
MTCPGLYTPQDLWDANDGWKANCGPSALAAVLGVPLAAVRRAFTGFPAKPWTTPTSMAAALAAQGVQHRVIQGMPQGDVHGVAFIQLRGRWDSAPERAQYRHTHWVGLYRERGELHVYDCNAGSAGGWLPSEVWKAQVLTEIIAGHRGASGKWAVRVVLEVLR